MDIFSPLEKPKLRSLLDKGKGSGTSLEVLDAHTHSNPYRADGRKDA